MVAPIQLLPGAVSEMLAQVSHTNTLTLADRYGLLAALLDESLSEDEQDAVNRLLWALRRGRIRVVETLSAIR